MCVVVSKRRSRRGGVDWRSKAYLLHEVDQLIAPVLLVDELGRGAAVAAVAAVVAVGAVATVGGRYCRVSMIAPRWRCRHLTLNIDALIGFAHEGAQTQPGNFAG